MNERTLLTGDTVDAFETVDDDWERYEFASYVAMTLPEERPEVSPADAEEALAWLGRFEDQFAAARSTTSPADDVRHGSHNQKDHGRRKGRGGGAMGGGTDTQSEHSTVGTDGRRTYDADRVSDVHDPYVNGQMAGTTPVEGQATFTIMGGGTGAGKGSLLKSGQVDLDNTVKADSDEAKLALPEYRARNDAGDPTAASYAHEESSDLAKRLVAESLASNRNTVLDGTGDSSIDKLAGKAAAARASGARVVGEYVTISFDDARARNASRAANNPDRAIVPDEVLVRTHSSVSRVLPMAVDGGVFDEVRLWDNSGPPGTSPKLVMESVGGSTTIHEQGLWDNFVAKGSGPDGEGARSEVVPGRVGDLLGRVDSPSTRYDLGNLRFQSLPGSAVSVGQVGGEALLDGDAEGDLGRHLDHVVTGHVHGSDDSTRTDPVALTRKMPPR